MGDKAMCFSVWETGKEGENRESVLWKTMSETEKRKEKVTTVTPRASRKIIPLHLLDFKDS